MNNLNGMKNVISADYFDPGNATRNYLSEVSVTSSTTSTSG